MSAAQIAAALADRVDRLVFELLPGGRREGHEWRCGSLAGEAGHSLGVHLAGRKAGIWADFATGERGDALDLVAGALGLGKADALRWSRQWLCLETGKAAVPRRCLPAQPTPEPQPAADRWRHPWRPAVPIAGTLAAAYLAGRGLRFDDPEGRALRFAARRARKAPIDERLEHHPALLAALCEIHTGEQVGVINIYLASDGRDRLRDSKGKTITGRAAGAAVMLSPFDAPTMGLVICEGVETGVAILQAGLSPVWACGGAGTLRNFPVLGGIEALTVAADQDGPGRAAAEAVAQRWRAAGCEAEIVAPPAGDWAQPRRRAAS